MQIIDMNRSGDTRHSFDMTDELQVQKAMDTFKELTGLGKFATVPGPDGAPGHHIREFDPTVENIIFRPQIIGG